MLLLFELLSILLIYHVHHSLSQEQDNRYKSKRECLDDIRHNATVTGDVSEHDESA